MIIADAQRTDEILDDMTDQLRAYLGEQLGDCVMIGIHTGGVTVAENLHRRLGLQEKLGKLSISFYRDDFSRIGLHPTVGTTELPNQLEDRTVILVDDVLSTGRTARAALNEIFDFGRPARVVFACLVERGGHELPIRADVAGLSLELDAAQHVKLHSSPMEIHLRGQK